MFMIWDHSFFAIFVLSKSQKLYSLCSTEDASNFCHPAVNDVNCSGSSKPGWSSHWGSVVQGFNVTEEGSLSLWNNKDKVKGDRGQKYSSTERSIRLHIANVYLKTCARTWLLSDTVSEATDLSCGSWDTCSQRKTYSWGCATTTSHTLSGTTSHIANCNWAVNLLSNHGAWNPVTSSGSVRIQGLA